MSCPNNYDAAVDLVVSAGAQLLDQLRRHRPRCAHGGEEVCVDCQGHAFAELSWLRAVQSLRAEQWGAE